MLRHVAVFTWVEGVTAGQVAAVAAGLEALSALVDGLRAFTHGPDLGLGAGRADYAVVADFDDVEAWRRYDTHPEHERVRSEIIGPLVAARAAVQFEVR